MADFLTRELERTAYRYERKFFVQNVDIPIILHLCKLHPKGFRKVYYPRYINNIYFDTHGFNYFYDNVEGEKSRIKVRIRWYGELEGHIKKPVLEFKVKNGLLGTKYSYPLSPFTLNSNFSKEIFKKVVNEADLPDVIRVELKNVEPVLLNQYHRYYLESFDRKFRLTIDSDMKFKPFNFSNPAALQKSLNYDSTVVELKYGSDMDDEAREIASLLPFPLTKSSKYVQGLERVLG